MQITPLPCLRDNYAYLVVCPRTRLAAVVDPSEAAPVRAAVAAAGVEMVALLCTHHHPDHVGGVEELLADLPGLAVYGHASERERIPGLTHPLEHGDRWWMGDVHLHALHVPGHTLGALAFVASETAVFTGDTLFVAGCGRLFEGTAEMMYRSLNTVLGALPNDTAVYPGHEYAEKNLHFAREVEPNNVATQVKLAQVTAQRAAGGPCIPSRMDEERATNPFLRVAEAEVRAFARARGADADDPVAVLAAVRRARDSF
jgi:hydroxyacylglutathione hydrolase